jgi:hypothetical protein
VQVRRRRRLVWIEAFLAGVSALFCGLFVVWKDWIEIVFRVDPDRHSGSLELVLALGFLAIGVAFATLARRELGRPSGAAERPR